MTRSQFLTAAAAFALALATGCSGYVDTTPGKEVEVSGKVTGVDAKFFKDTRICLRATGGNGAVGTSFKLNPDGTFTGKMIAGQYAYYLGGESENDRKAEATLKSAPADIKSFAENRQISIDGGNVELKF